MELMAGGIAGGVSKTCVAPLERAKILFQTRRLPGLGVPSILMHIWNTEGAVGLFRGNSASVLRIVPYAAIHFGVYEQYRRAIVSCVYPTETSASPQTTASDASYTQQQQQIDGAGATSGDRGDPGEASDTTTLPPLHHPSHIVRNIGLADAPTDIPLSPRMVTHTAASADGHSSRPDSAAHAAARQQQVQPRQWSAPPVVHPVWDLLAGSMAGATAVVMTYPLDLARTRMAWAADPIPAAKAPGNAGVGLAAAHCGSSSSARSYHTHRPHVPVNNTSNLQPDVKHGLEHRLHGQASHNIQSSVHNKTCKPRQGRRSIPTHSKSAASVVCSKYTASGGPPWHTGASTGPAHIIPLPQTHHTSSLPVSSSSSIRSRSMHSIRQMRYSLRCRVEGSMHHASSAPIARASMTTSPSVAGVSQALPGHVAHPSVTSVLQQTFRSEGVPGLYRGMVPTLLGIVPYAGIKFYCYQSMKAMYKQREQLQQKQSQAPSNVSSRLPLPMALLFGGVSGLLAQTATYPLDVVRRRMQVEGYAVDETGLRQVRKVKPSTIATAKAIVKEEGLRGLIRGLYINYIKVVPSTAIGFTVYDYCKQYLDVQGNL